MSSRCFPDLPVLFVIVTPPNGIPSIVSTPAALCRSSHRCSLPAGRETSRKKPNAVSHAWAIARTPAGSSLPRIPSGQRVHLTVQNSTEQHLWLLHLPIRSPNWPRETDRRSRSLVGLRLIVTRMSPAQLTSSPRRAALLLLAQAKQAFPDSDSVPRHTTWLQREASISDKISTSAATSFANFIYVSDPFTVRAL